MGWDRGQLDSEGWFLSATWSVVEIFAIFALLLVCACECACAHVHLSLLILHKLIRIGADDDNIDQGQLIQFINNKGDKAICLQTSPVSELFLGSLVLESVSMGV